MLYNTQPWIENINGFIYVSVSFHKQMEEYRYRVESEWLFWYDGFHGLQIFLSLVEK